MLFALITQGASAQAPGEKWLYNDRGQNTGLQVTVNGLVLTVHSENDSILRLDGMPSVTIEKEPVTSRHAGVLVGKTEAVRFVYDGRGYLRHATVGDAKLDLTVPSKEGMVTETLRNKFDHALTQVTVKGDTPSLEPNPPYFLDPLKERLGLAAASLSLQIEHTEGSSATVLHDGAGHPLLYVVEFGPNRFGFDAAGKPLFVEVSIQMSHTALSMPESHHNPIAIHEMNAVVPSRIVVLADGTVGAFVEAPAAGAIAAFWSGSTTKGNAVSFRTKQDHRPSSPATPAPNGSATASRGHLRPGRNEGSCVTLYEGSTQICYTDTSGNSLGCGPTTEYYETYCPYGTGGGGTPTPPPPIGGTGGAASNKITADSALRTQVNNAINTAQTKLNKCAAALLNLKASGGTATLGQVLAGKANPPAGGWTLQNFMTIGGLTGQNFVMDTDSNTNGYCAGGYPAYTQLYDHTTYVCQREYNTDEHEHHDRSMGNSDS